MSLLMMLVLYLTAGFLYTIFLSDSEEWVETFAEIWLWPVPFFGTFLCQFKQWVRYKIK